MTSGLGGEVLLRDRFCGQALSVVWGSHPIIDAALVLREHMGGISADVEQISVLSGKPLEDMLPYHWPKTGLEAKFSMEYCAAVALLDGAGSRSRHGLSTRSVDPSGSDPRVRRRRGQGEDSDPPTGAHRADRVGVPVAVLDEARRNHRHGHPRGRWSSCPR